MLPVILASSSVYRKALFSRLQIPFESFSPDIDETPYPNEEARNLVTRLSLEKAKKAANQFNQHICIGSDEVATLDNQIFGKPGSFAQAQKQLRQISGKKLFFYTGVCVYAPCLSHEETRLVTTAVQFKDLTERMIQSYLEKEQPFDTAASFKSESLGCALIQSFEGDDHTAIMGLPLIALCNMLETIAYPILS